MLWSLLTSRSRRRSLFTDPAGLQERLLRHLVSRAARTEAGVRWGYREIAGERDIFKAYRARVPLQNFTDFDAAVKRMRRGEPDVLWPGVTRCFALSGGTTAGPKWIPQSPELLEGGRRFFFDMVLHYASLRASARFFLKPRITLSGGVHVDPENPRNLVGEVSGLHRATATGRLGFLRRRLIAPADDPDEANLIRKMQRLIETNLERDIHWILFGTSWGVMLLELALAEASRRRGGRVTSIAEIWPRLKLILTGGRPLAPYRRRIEELCAGLDIDFVEFYGATEGNGTFQNDVADPAMLLHTDCGVFFEFVALAQYGSPSAERLTIADVVPNQPYVVFMSTCGGLWAYDMADVVRFTEVRPPRLLIEGRAIEMLDSLGEYLTCAQLREALAAACARHGAEVVDFHVTVDPVRSDSPHHHQWAIEWRTPPGLSDGFAGTLDRELRRICTTYDDSRNNRGLGAPEIVALPAGTFVRMFERRGRLNVQTKPRLASEGRQTMEELMAARK